MVVKTQYVFRSNEGFITIKFEDDPIKTEGAIIKKTKLEWHFVAVLASVFI